MSNHPFDPNGFIRAFSDLLGNVDPFSELFSESHLSGEETPNAYIAHVELPGFKAHEVSLEVTSESAEGIELAIKAVRGNRTVQRHIAMGGSGHPINPDAISSKLEDGILTITAPKRVPPQPRKITVL